MMLGKRTLSTEHEGPSRPAPATGRAIGSTSLVQHELGTVGAMSAQMRGGTAGPIVDAPGSDGLVDALAGSDAELSDGEAMEIEAPDRFAQDPELQADLAAERAAREGGEEVEPSARRQREQILTAQVSASPFTASVALRPRVPAGVRGGRQVFRAEDLVIDAVNVSDKDRGNTQFERQESHTVAWTLLRAGLRGFAGRTYPELVAFVQQGIEELRADASASAQSHATAVFPAALSPTSGEHDLAFWIGEASNRVREYVVAYQMSKSATYRNGRPTGHNEAGHRTTLEQAEAAGGAGDPAAIVAAACGLLDVNFRIEQEHYAQAVQHWFKLLGQAFPRVMALHGDAVWATVTAPARAPSARWLGGAPTMTAALGAAPAVPAPPAEATHADAVARRTDLTAHVRLAPAEHAPAAAPTDATEQAFALGELDVLELDLGTERPPTRWTNQRSHTVAWTLVRAAMQAHARRPLADLHAYLVEQTARAAADLGPAQAASDGPSAQTLASVLQAMAGTRLPLSEWYRHVSASVVEVLRLHQLTASATYNAEERPSGHGEGTAMATLRLNEKWLAEYGALHGDPATIGEKARSLLDVNTGNPTLPWQNLARAVIHWGESLTAAFPRLMAAGGAQITAPVLDRPITTEPGTAWPVPPGAATIRDLVERERAGGGAAPAEAPSQGASSMDLS